MACETKRFRFLAIRYSLFAIRYSLLAIRFFRSGSEGMGRPRRRLVDQVEPAVLLGLFGEPRPESGHVEQGDVRERRVRPVGEREALQGISAVALGTHAATRPLRPLTRVPGIRSMAGEISLPGPRRGKRPALLAPQLARDAGVERSAPVRTAGAVYAVLPASGHRIASAADLDCTLRLDAGAFCGRVNGRVRHEQRSDADDDHLHGHLQPPACSPLQPGRW